MTLGQDAMKPTPETDFEPPNVWAWSQTAEPGDCLTYWEGNLAEACEKEALAEKEGATSSVARDVRREASILYECGDALLCQRKIGPLVKAYIIKRRASRR
ncbi:MAG: hypothetical protein K0Q60_2321 [Microvirga sp.]|jgi:hypothetical protein|nr:hypothetical protein [Microvirga sp.]